MTWLKRILRLARIIADLSAYKSIETANLAEAIQYRPRKSFPIARLLLAARTCARLPFSMVARGVCSTCDDADP